MWFMHDDAPPHFNINARQKLKYLFGKTEIEETGSLTSKIARLNPLNFNLWGHLKSLVGVTRQSIIDWFKIALFDVFGNKILLEGYPLVKRLM